jgi:hypothetical protein
MAVDLQQMINKLMQRGLQCMIARTCYTSPNSDDDEDLYVIFFINYKNMIYNLGEMRCTFADLEIEDQSVANSAKLFKSFEGALDELQRISV